MKMHPDEARMRDYHIDTCCYPWLAYKGERFRPTESHECFTSLESDLIRQLNRVSENSDLCETIIWAHQ